MSSTVWTSAKPFTRVLGVLFLVGFWYGCTAPQVTNVDFSVLDSAQVAV